MNAKHAVRISRRLAIDHPRGVRAVWQLGLGDRSVIHVVSHGTRIRDVVFQIRIWRSGDFRYGRLSPGYDPDGFPSFETGVTRYSEPVV